MTLLELLAVCGFGSMALFAIGVIAMIVQLLRKKSRAIPTIIMIVAVIIFVVSLVITFSCYSDIIP